MANQNYIGVNGIVTQSLPEIITENTEAFKNTYGQNINVDSNSPDGQMINILSQIKKDILDLCVQYYNNLDTERVIGIPQQILYKLNNCILKAYTYSYVYVNVTVTQSVNLQGLDADIENPDGTGYTVSDGNGNRWILTESQTLVAGTHTLNFRAAELGNVTATPNTITIMETVIAGVSGVTNPANNYITGATGESDSEFRIRRNQTVSSPSQGFDDALQAQLLNLDNVTQAKVYNNRENTTQDGIPAHTVWVIVEGGLSQEIGQAIYANIPPGIPMKGTQTVSVQRPSGDFETVKYDVPTAVNLYVKMDIQLLAGAIDEDYIKSLLALQTFNIGQSAEGVYIATVVKDIVTTNGSPYNVLVSTNGTNWAEVVTPSGLDEYFSISAANVTVNVIGSST
jgi:hypothetical protein